MVEDEAKKEGPNAENAKKYAEDLKKALKEAKRKLLASEDAKKELEGKVDITETRVSSTEAEKKLAQEALAKVEAEVEEKINVGKDELIDLAMYRFWEHNQNADISFMESEAEGLLARWKIRLEEEKKLLSVIASGAVAEADDVAGEVTSQNPMLSRSEASIAVEIEDMVRTTITEVAL